MNNQQTFKINPKKIKTIIDILLCYDQSSDLDTDQDLSSFTKGIDLLILWNYKYTTLNDDNLIFLYSILEYLNDVLSASDGLELIYVHEIIAQLIKQDNHICIELNVEQPII